jgi:hypothetical protein
MAAGFKSNHRAGSRAWTRGVGRLPCSAEGSGGKERAPKRTPAGISPAPPGVVASLSPLVASHKVRKTHSCFPLREMLIEAVEKRFGTVESVPAGHVLEFLSDNGGAYIAHDTRRIARSLGLTPINTPVCSPQSNGMAKSFVNTFRRDYESKMDLTDAPTVLAQLAAAFEHFNEVHPHSSLKMKSPREFRRQRAEQMRQAQLNEAALHCV